MTTAHEKLWACVLNKEALSLPYKAELLGLISDVRDVESEEREQTASRGTFGSNISTSPT